MEQIPAAAELSVLRPVPTASRLVKQADLVFAMYTFGEEFTAEQKLKELRLLLSAHRARLVAVGVLRGRHRGRGRLPRPGLRPALESVFTDLHDLRQREQWPAHRGAGRCVDGLRGRVRWYARFRRQHHVRAATAGQAHLPVVPDGGTRFPRSSSPSTKSQATYRLLSGPPIVLAHHGEEFTLHEQPVSLPIAEIEHRTPPRRHRLRAVPAQHMTGANRLGQQSVEHRGTGR